MVALSSVIALDALLALIRVVRNSSEYSHIALVLPGSLTLIYLKRGAIFSKLNLGRPGLRSGIAPIVVLAALVLLRRIASLTVDQQLSASVFLLVSFWIAAFYACFGSTAARRALFPLTFLYFLVPWPKALTEMTIVALQHTSADLVAWMFNLAEIPTLRQGQTFLLVNQQIEVAKECSGIRSSIALLMTGLLFGHLFLRSLWSKAVLLALIPPLAVFKNGLRITTLSILGTYVDPGFLNGPLHHQGGIVFFALALGTLIACLSLLRRFEQMFFPSGPAEIGLCTFLFLIAWCL